MGKASSSKKVAKAARTGGGRTRRGSTSWLFPTVMAVVVVLGTLLVVLSRNDLAEADDTPPRASEPGKRAGDHWHAALGFYVCGKFQPNIADETDPRGIHTHDDGVVHIHPFTPRSGGRNATLDVFFQAVGARVTDDTIDVPGSPVKRNGQRCDGRAAKVRTMTWDHDDPEAEGKEFTGNPADLRPTDRQLITIAFMPEGTEIPRPPSASQLDQLTDLAPPPTDPLAAVPEGTEPVDVVDDPTVSTSTPPTSAAPPAAP